MEAALQIREALFNGVDPIPNLANETVTGGRLNVYNSINEILANCGPCPSAAALGVDTLTDVQATVSWISSDSTVSSNLRFRMVGDSMWTSINNVNSPINLLNLLSCTEYEVEITDICSDTISDPSILIFKTDGCCDAPTLQFENTTETLANVSWNPILAAITYDVYIYTDTDTMLINESEPTSEFTGLMPCTEYTVQVISVCDNGFSEASVPLVFTTAGCGACLDLSYCETTGGSTSDEWIERVVMGSIDNTSGDDGGYGDYTDISADFNIGNTYPFELYVGYSFFAYDEYALVYIDYNHDGDFDDAGEVAYDSGNTFEDQTTGTIMIDPGAMPGLTRMRVAMRYDQPVNDACHTDFDYGEMEDYCINLVAGNFCAPPSGLSAGNISETGADLSWMANGSPMGFELEYRVAGEIWQAPMNSTGTTLSISGLAACEQYQFRVKSICDNSESTFSDPFNFETVCNCAIPQNLDTVSTTQTTAQMAWELVPFADEFELRYRPAGTAIWSLASATTNNVAIEELQPCTEYESQIKAICPTAESDYSSLFSFKTQCDPSTGLEELPLVYGLKVKPNPFHSQLEVDIVLLEQMNFDMDVFDINGKLIISQKEQSLKTGLNTFLLDLEALAPGVHFLRISNARGTLIRKIIKM